MKYLCHGDMEEMVWDGPRLQHIFLIAHCSLRWFDNLAAHHFRGREQTGDERQEDKVLGASVSFLLYCQEGEAVLYAQ